MTLHALRHTYYILGSYKPQQSFEVGQHKKITYLTLTSKVKIIVMSFLYSAASNIYRITAVLKVETDITNIHSETNRTSCKTSHNVCRDLQNWNYCFYLWPHTDRSFSISESVRWNWQQDVARYFVLKIPPLIHL